MAMQFNLGVDTGKQGVFVERKSILKNNNINLLSAISNQNPQGVGFGDLGQFGNQSANPDEIQIKMKKNNIPGANNGPRRSSRFSQKSDDKQKKGDSNSRKIDIFDLEQQERFPRVSQFIDSTSFQLVMMIFTIFALFGDDTRVISTHKSADDYFDGVNYATISMFMLQIILQFICKAEYRNSFFFWLDLISTISILFDIQAVQNAFFFQQNFQSTFQLTRASRASRIGTKAGRVVRLIRLIRITKVYKQTQENKKSKKNQNMNLQSRKNRIHEKFKNIYNGKKDTIPNNNNNNTNGHFPGKDNENNLSKQDSRIIITKDKRGSTDSKNKPQLNSQESQSHQQDKFQVETPSSTQAQESSHLEEPSKEGFKESRVSKRLSDLTTKRVVIILLLLLFVMPLLQKSFYFDIPASNVYHITALSELTYTQGCTLDMLQRAISKTVNTLQQMKQPLVYFSSPFQFTPSLDYQDSGFESLREAELIGSFIYFDTNRFLSVHTSDQSAAQSLIKNTSILLYESVMSTRDQAVLQAILSISKTIFVCIVLTTASFFFSKDANELALGPIERMINKVNQIANDPLSAKDQELIDEEQDQYETRIIENAIVKIGALLALGFGEAGSEIIGSNIAKHGDVDPMISGKKKCCIYGFCDIRNFTDATEVLQEDVMIFVNNIGEIVHSMVDRFMGAANKNIGDAFLLVWKFQEDKYQVLDDNSIDFKDKEYARMMAEFALLSFMKIQAKINREPLILEYRKDPRLNQRMANYKVKIGFGLHIGWSIEGAIGSEFKIDASYLSPNVSMASRLEGATKGYGVPLLFSSEIYTLLTPSFQAFTRQVDYVKIKGQNKPIGFHTVDMKIDNLPVSKFQDLSIEEKMEIEKHKKQITLQFIESNCFDVDTYLKNDKDLRLILTDFDFEFNQDYTTAFEAYLSGDWQRSKQLFEALLKRKPDDGPTKATLEYMHEQDYTLPDDWKGFKPYND